MSELEKFASRMLIWEERAFALAIAADLRSLEQRLTTQQPAPQERSSEAETIPSHVVTLVKRALERDPAGLLAALEKAAK